jgi:DNA topoisomerase-1
MYCGCLIKARPLQGRINFLGLDISVECRMGAIRQWKDPHNGQEGMTRMRRPYGYIKGTLGSDGDHCDVYVGPHRDAANVYIVTQMKAPDFTRFDEEKILLGFTSQAEARAFYLQHYDDSRFMGKITAMPFAEFAEAVMQTRGSGGKPLIKSHVRAYLRRTGSKVVAVKDFERKKNKVATNVVEGMAGTDKQLRAAALARGYRVPPGWGDLWVNKDPDGHIQVRCTDSKGRRVGIYHPEHNEGQSAAKFERMKVFAFAHSKIMKQIEADMATKPEAHVLYLISQTGFRLGSDNDTGADKQAYGASTLLAKHVTVKGDTATFAFTGKKGVAITHVIRDKKIAAMVSKKKTGSLFDTNDTAVRAYMAELSEGKFTPKDFRTFVANEEALRVMEKMPEPLNARDAKKAVLAVCDAVAKKLGNTRTVAKDSYIAPEIWRIWKHAA